MSTSSASSNGKYETFSMAETGKENKTEFENNADEDELSENISNIYRAITHETEFNASNGKDSDPILKRLSTLSKTLSTMNAESMKSFKINENDFD